MDEATIAGLKAAHGSRLTLFTTADGEEVVVRPPNRREFDRFLDEVSKDEGQRSAALSALVRSCVVYPEPKEFEALWERHSGLAVPIAARLQEMASATRMLEGKDL